MHASLWRFRGDPDELLRGYDALVAAVPAANMRLHLCLRADDGIVVVDTCPSREAFEAFAEAFGPMAAAHGLPAPERLGDHPVHAAFVDAQRRV